MSESGIDAYRVTSVLGYCLLPMVGVGALSVVFTLEYVPHYFSRIPLINSHCVSFLKGDAGIYSLHRIDLMVHVCGLGDIRSSVANV